MKKPLAFLVALVIGFPLSAATLRVNNAAGTSPDHATIQAAINAAADGDTILIEGSATAYAGFTVLNKRLNLIGPGYGLGLNLGTPANKLGASVGSSISYIRTSSASAGTADGSLVMGLEFAYDLTLDGCANVTVSRCAFGLQSGSARLQVSGPNNLVSQCFMKGSSVLYFYSPGGSFSGTRIENNVMPDYGFYVGSATLAHIYLRNNLLSGFGGLASGVTLQADNNIFLSAVSSSSSATFRNNILPTTPSGLTGSGNLTGVVLTTVIPAYQNSSASPDGRYQLSTDVINPALNAGTDGTHIGPFGGPNPYILSGIPPLPTIDEISAPQFAAPGAPLTIRVKVGARP